jgi:hypothetical protein
LIYYGIGEIEISAHLNKKENNVIKGTISFLTNFSFIVFSGHYFNWIHSFTSFVILFMGFTFMNIIIIFITKYRNLKSRIKDLKEREIIRINLTKELNGYTKRWQTIVENNDIVEMNRISERLDEIRLLLTQNKMKKKSILYADLEKDITELEESLKINEPDLL